MRKVSFPSSLRWAILLCLGALIVMVPTLVLAQTQSTVSINSGGSATGSFTADQYFSGGSTYTNTATIDMSQITTNPPPAAIFNTERYGAMTYTIPNLSGAQTVTLYFAETYLTAAGQRLFNVSINGTAALSNFDIYASAGGQNRAIARTFNTTANSSGQVVIQFTAVTQNPKVNGITVTGGSANPTQVPPTGIPPTGIPPTGIPPTGIPPASISINSGGSATGSFTADQYYSGGSTYTNTATINMSQITSNPPPAAIFNSERYGAMTYTIPNRSGAQTVTLYFAETYVTAAGQRLFNVSINGTAALSSFDIYASAGGQNRAIARSFNTTANNSGQVVIQFTAVTQSPKINGITVAGGNVNPTSVPPTGVPPTTVPPTTVPPTGVPPASISINAGGSATGSFAADQYYSGGSTYTNSATIDMSQITTNPPPAAIFNTERYGAMTYTIPNRSGAQTVTLYFAETYLTASGQRLFNVSLNGTSVLSSFDIYASAGGQNRAIARSFNTTANSSGQVVIQFTAVTQSPKINGITVAGGIGDFQTLSVTKSGSGTVTSSPSGINCGSTCSASFATGSSVTLTASGGTFTGWSGACSGTSTACTVSMTQTQSVTATFSGTYNPCPATGDCRILPLGDSITDGTQTPGGYRIELFRLAHSAGKHMTFVGSLTNGPTTVDGVAFPRNHEGHSGWTIDQIAGLVPSPALNTMPHIVLVHAGTNDMYQASTASGAPQRLDNLLGKLVTSAPDALIVVAQIIPLSNTSQDANVRGYDSALPAIVNARVAQGKHVVLVDMHTNFPTSELTDGIHPTPAGYARMANIWYGAIGSLLR